MTSQKGAPRVLGVKRGTATCAIAKHAASGPIPVCHIPPGWPGPAHWLTGWAPMRSASTTRARSATSLDPQHGVVVMETWRQCIRYIVIYIYTQSVWNSTIAILRKRECELVWCHDFYMLCTAHCDHAWRHVRIFIPQYIYPCFPLKLDDIYHRISSSNHIICSAQNSCSCNKMPTINHNHNQKCTAYATCACTCMCLLIISWVFPSPQLKPYGSSCSLSSKLLV